MAAPLSYQFQAGDDRWMIARVKREQLGWSDVALLAKQMATDNPQIKDWRRVPPTTVIALAQATP